MTHQLFFSFCPPHVSTDVAAGPRLNNNQLYKFSYMTEVLVDRTKGSREGSAGYRISSDVGVHLVWRDPSSKDDQLIQVAVRGCTHRLRQDMMSFQIKIQNDANVWPHTRMCALLLNLVRKPTCHLLFKKTDLVLALCNYSLRSQMWESTRHPLERRKTTSSMDPQQRAFWGGTDWQLLQNLSWYIWKMER